MRGFVLSTAVYAIVAIVSIAALLALVNTYAPGVMRSGLCWAVRGVSTVFPGSDWSRASVPEFCSEVGTYAETVVEGGQDEAIEALAVHSLACWKKAGSGIYNITMTCSALYLQSKAVYTVGEADITGKLSAETGCTNPEDLMNDYDDFTHNTLTQPCGDRNDIVWNISQASIPSNTVVVIKYIPASGPGLGKVYIK